MEKVYVFVVEEKRTTRVEVRARDLDEAEERLNDLWVEDEISFDSAEHSAYLDEVENI